MGLIDRIKLFFSTTERVYEPVFNKPHFNKEQEYPPFVKRKWKQLVIAMEKVDVNRIDALQRQLTESGYPSPTTASEARELCRD